MCLWILKMQLLLVAMVVAAAAFPVAKPPRLQPAKGPIRERDDRTAAKPEPVAILRQSKDFKPDGSVSFGFESADGIQREETISQRQITDDAAGAVSRGSYSYTAPDGKLYSVNWVADETGFHAFGDHIPKLWALHYTLGLTLSPTSAKPKKKY